MTENPKRNPRRSQAAKAGAIIVPVTLFEQNCTIIWCRATKKAVVIDPGGDVPKIQAAIKQTGVTVEKIWLTHGHIDHVGGAAELRDALTSDRRAAHRRQIPARQCRLERRALWHDRRAKFRARPLARRGRAGSIGDLTFDILHCPGHSPGSIVFFSNELRFAHVGDVLFAGSVGRTDLPGGSHAS